MAWTAMRLVPLELTAPTSCSRSLAPLPRPKSKVADASVPPPLKYIVLAKPSTRLTAPEADSEAPALTVLPLEA